MIFSKILKFGQLEVIVFVAGAAIMVLELIGSRILAPYLGASIYVWASLIGIILGALSLGYYLGGYFSRKNPHFLFLTEIFFISGLAILMIALFKDTLLPYVLLLGIKLGSMAAVLALFALPSALLGMISPYAVRLKVSDIKGAGNVAGNLYALSTLGSIFGTFLAGFYLIPTFGSTQILFGLSLVLILFALPGAYKSLKAVFIFLIVFNWIFSRPAAPGVIFEADSAYNHIQVKDLISKKDGAKVRALYLGTEIHSIIYQNGDRLHSAYHRLYRLDSLFKPEIKKALTLGGGGYIAPLDFLARYPASEMTVLEIDPKITQTAKDYFNLKDDPRLKIRHEDGRIFLNSNREKFDVIYGDAFASYFSIPFQLTTKEAMEKIRQSLTADGIFVLNVINSLAGKKSLLFQAEYQTLKEYFPQVYVFPAYYYDGNNLEEIQNLVLVAAKNPRRQTKADLLKFASAEQKELLDQLWEKAIEISPKTKILTDDFAPVDYYISKLL